MHGTTHGYMNDVVDRREAAVRKLEEAEERATERMKGPDTAVQSNEGPIATAFDMLQQAIHRIGAAVNEADVEFEPVCTPDLEGEPHPGDEPDSRAPSSDLASSLRAAVADLSRIARRLESTIERSEL